MRYHVLNVVTGRKTLLAKGVHRVILLPQYKYFGVALYHASLGRLALANGVAVATQLTCRKQVELRHNNLLKLGQPKRCFVCPLVRVLSSKLDITMRALLLKPGKNSCTAYKNIWSGSRSPEKSTRELFYQLWGKFYPHADPHFVTEFQKDLDARFWEMYLTVLIGEKYKVKSASKGPDIQILENENTLAWVEAVIATAGDPVLPDSVPEMQFGTGIGQPTPEDKIILRLTSALKSKLDVHKKYLKNNILTQDQPFVIAINGSPIRWMGGSEHRRILKALFPIGEEYVTFDQSTNSLSHSQFNYRGVINKENGAGVPVDSFFNADYELVSGVVYSSKDCCNIPRECGSEIVYIHNPFAKNPLDKGFFDVGTEFYGEVKGDECTLKLVEKA